MPTGVMRADANDPCRLVGGACDAYRRKHNLVRINLDRSIAASSRFAGGELPMPDPCAESVFGHTGMSKTYMPQLDGLRAVAVASVLVYHWFTPPFALGQWGVTLFFVLSGYLITRNIAALRGSGVPVTTAARIFFVRRTLRLFPAFYLVVLLGTLLYDDIRRDWVWYATYLSNILLEIRPHFSALKASWSLSVEEQFYIVWFFVMMCVPAKRLPWIMVLAFVAEPLVRCTWLAPDHPMFRTWTLWANCDGLLLGALLYFLEARGREFPLSGVAAILMAVSLATLAVLVPPQSPAYSPIASVLVSA